MELLRRLRAQPVKEASLPDSPHGPPKLVAPSGSGGGPSYTYRGAQIGSNAKGTTFSFRLEGFPHDPNGDWAGLGNLDMIVRLVDRWLDTEKLPPPYVTPKQAT